MREISHDAADARHDGRQTDNGVQRRNSLRQIRRRDPLANKETYTRKVSLPH